MSVENQIELFRRGVQDFIGEDSLTKKLQKGEPLNVKFGVDPTAPDIHLGHTVPLQKLRQFQQFGHNAILVVGNYTAKIGDPSGKSETRPMLSDEEIAHNMKTYTDQVYNILDKDQTRIVYNADWLSKFTLEDLLKLGSKASVQQMLQRRDFSKRIEEGSSLTLTELLYPLLVGYDSVELEADVEIGGTDQLFNFMASRNVQSAYGQEPEVVLTLPLLEGLDGKRKMSKSYGNTIGVRDSPQSMYGKVMSISDDLMVRYFELLSDIDTETLDRVRTVVSGLEDKNPMDYKQMLAREMVTRFHSVEDAIEAQNYFDRTVREKRFDEENLQEFEVTKTNTSLVGIIRDITGRTGKDAKRLIEQGGVKIGSERIQDTNYSVSGENPIDIHVGKNSHYRLTFKD